MTAERAADKSEVPEAPAASRRLRRGIRARWIPGVGLMAVAFVLLAVGAVLMAANEARLRDSIRGVDQT